MREQATTSKGHRRYEGLCSALCRLDRRLEGRRLPESSNRGSARNQARVRQQTEALGLAGICLAPSVLLSAGRGALALFGLLAGVVGAISLVVLGPGHAAIVAFAAIAVPVLAREAVLSYPAGAARRRAENMMKGVPESANLMIMSLRHEPSLSRAIRFASERGSAFSGELKRCVWEVVMGRHASFEDSLQSLGARWERHDPDLKASIHAMVTASCEATEDGKRRALDRANNAVMSGAKRRIEAYALSLSTPSMVIFGLGILLPLMIGSFLPMLSWSIWSPGAIASGEQSSGDSNLIETIFLMNVLFPCIALLIAVGAVSRHPMGAPKRLQKGTGARALVVAALASIVFSGLSLSLLAGATGMVLALVLGTAPCALALMALGRGSREGRDARAHRTGLEDALFKTGALMLEGQNFESALHHAGAEVRGDASETLRRLSFRSAVAGQGFDDACRSESSRMSDANAIDGLKVVREAAGKDELAAGMLAMDLAAYLKDLHDLETTLKNRLKPTISMMRATAFALGPIVMGVTFAVYMTLMSMAPGGTSGLDAGAFFLVLGAFLAETNAVVSYFVWGIEGAKNGQALMWSIGSCILVSELVYIATATIAS